MLANLRCYLYCIIRHDNYSSHLGNEQSEIKSLWILAKHPTYDKGTCCSTLG
jgi:hypothetical protein